MLYVGVTAKAGWIWWLVHRVISPLFPLVPKRKKNEVGFHVDKHFNYIYIFYRAVFQSLYQCTLNTIAMEQREKKQQNKNKKSKLIIFTFSFLLQVSEFV